MLPDSSATITIYLASQDATLEFGQQLGVILAPGQIVALSGDLGAGKTTLTQGIAAGLPRGRYVEIAGAGHMAPLEKPAEVNRAIAEFLRT